MPTEPTVINICTVEGCGISYEIPKKCASRSKRCPAHQAEYERLQIRILKQAYKERKRKERVLSVRLRPIGKSIFNPNWGKSETIK